MKKAIFGLMLATALVTANGANAAAVLSGGGSASGLSACSSIADNGLKGVVGCVIGIIDDITVLIIAASVVYIIYGAFEMIRSEEKRESGRQTVVYGIIGLFVMISIWGFVNILDNTFNLSRDYIPAPQFHQQAP
ncbi:MAG TPA: hypothetical protein VFT82_03015 [Candidatus Paceibacterota bacterium]|nr:hypothetical protein [Candidatus Paceibacterota bacterium]